MNKDFYITELIEPSVLQKVQDSFSNMIGMAALTTDEDGHPVTEGSNFTDYCMKYTRQTKVGCERCKKCDRDGALKTHKTGKPTSYYCHSGLIDFAAPIMAEGKMIGSFIGGQVLTEPPNPERIRFVADQIGVDFEEYWAAVQKVPVIDKHRVVDATNFLYTIAGVLSDMAISKRRAIEAGIEIERSAKMKTDFLANMSHEIRTPMNAVIGMAEMALRENIPDAARNYIQQIKSSGRALLTIINDILDYSKIESGKLDIIPAEYEPLALFNDVTNIIMTRLLDKDVELSLDISPELPRLLFGDNIRVRQILINLANNAVKFTKHGHIKITVDFEWRSTLDILMKISVQDTGIGIKPEELAHIFESFQQADSKRNREIEGTGLGLSISRSLVKMMGGELFCESEYEKGSTFSFTLPQAVVDKKPSMQVREPQKIYALAFLGNAFLEKRFRADCATLGVTNTEIIVSDAEVPITCNVSMEEHPNHSIFLFLNNVHFTPELRSYVEEHPQINAILVADFFTEVQLTSPNMMVVKKPLSAMNLSLLFNHERLSFSSNPDHADDAGFIAPDAWILIVDDNAVNLTVAEGLLEPLKMHIVSATSGKEALKLAGQRHFDLIFMDHMMPEMDGVEATHLIRQEYPSYADTPILALTANAVDNAREMFLREGLNDFIPKPIELSVLMSKVRQWLPQEKIKQLSEEERERELLKRAVAAENAKAATSKNSAPQILDLDTGEAISMLGSEALFRNVLREYHRAILQKAQRIKEHETTGDLEAYTIEVHALKSSSKQIGASRLSSMAAELEDAGRAGDMEMIRKYTTPTLKKYMSYYEGLKPFLPAEEKETAEDTEETDSAALREGFDRLRNAIDDLDMDAVEATVNTLMKYQLPEDQQTLRKHLRGAAEDMDYDTCLTLLDEWERIL